MAAAVSALAACAGAPPPSANACGRFAPLAADGLLAHVYADASPSADRYVLLLPGSSGLHVFEDDTHYFAAAATLSEQGLRPLVVDYRAAWHAAEHPELDATGDKIAWVAEQVVARCRQNGLLAATARGAVVAWSLGAEGVWSLFATPARCDAMRLAAAVTFYPANEDERPLRAIRPLLVLVGDADDVTPLADLREHLVVDDQVSLQVFAGSHHGFDIASLTAPRRVSLLPVIGPHATFAGDARGRVRAIGLVRDFLAEHVR